jgi:hypothetical protein
MPKLTINGLEIEHSGNLIDALMSHPRTAELSGRDGGKIIIPADPGFTYDGVKYDYAGVSGNVLTSGTAFHDVTHTDYGVWQHDNNDGTWKVIYSDGNWWCMGTTTVDPESWEMHTNPNITDRTMLHWWGNDAHTVDPASKKYGPRDGVSWS